MSEEQYSGTPARGDGQRFQTTKSEPVPNQTVKSAPASGREVSIARWLAFYLVCLVALAVPLVVLASHHHGELGGVWAATAGAFKAGTAGGAMGLIAKV